MPRTGRSVTTTGFFVLRSPLLPWEELERGSGPSHARPNREELRKRLREITIQPEAREAIFLASPDLFSHLTAWLNDPDSKLGQKVERSLVRYVYRMAGRSTPFGLFAGYSVGSIGDVTRLHMSGRDKYQRHTRLDMDYIYALTSQLGSQPAIRWRLTYRPNSSLYQSADRLRYVEVKIEDQRRRYHLVSVESTSYLTGLLTQSEAGATLQHLVSFLQKEVPDVSSEEATAFLEEVIDSQLLVPDILPAVTGREPTEGLIEVLKSCPSTQAYAETLDMVTRDITGLDHHGLGVQTDRYYSIANRLEALPSPVKLSRLLQVDMHKPAPEATLGSNVLQEVIRGVELLHKIARRSTTSELSRFRDAFLSRYEHRTVPLAEVLDEENGIGFGASQSMYDDGSGLLRGLPFRADNEQPSRWDRRESFLLHRLSEALSTGAVELNLTASDLEQLGGHDPLPLPTSLAVMATIAAADHDAVNRGDFQVLLEKAGGPSAARMLGRFCHGDQHLRELVVEHLRTEEALEPDAVFAEIAHMPAGRIGNVLLRPVLRTYEIPYLGRSGAPLENQIPISDLLVTVINGEVVLHSKRLGKRVIPRLSNAHNVQGMGQGVYRFLYSLQEQGVTPGIGWSWGSLTNAPFLPRVTSGKLVLERARWLITREELNQLGSLEGDARYEAVEAWRARRKIPRWVVHVDGDNELPVDFDNPLSLDAFVDSVKRRSLITLIELFPSPDKLCATGPEGRFVHELVIPLVRTARPTAPRQLPAVPAVSFPRTFAPGAEWLYAKIYTGTATADRLLADALYPVIKRNQVSGAIDRWFFLRYGDPEHHIRIRFHGDPVRLYSEVLQDLHRGLEPLIRSELVSRFQLDTYQREVERYGGPEGILLAEKFFHADSEWILDVIRADRSDTGLAPRWRYALKGMDMILTGLGFDLDQKLSVARSLRDAFAREFKVDGHFKAAMGAKFREARAELAQLLTPADLSRSESDTRVTTWLDRVAPIATELMALADARRLATPLHDLAGSFLHMHVNRMLRTAPRKHEVVLYDFLARLYNSQAARTEAVR